jgi:hypothetical protein
MVTKNNILIWLLIATILNACCWGDWGYTWTRVSFGTNLTILPTKNSFKVDDTIKVRLKIPTQLYDTLSKKMVEYRNQDIFLHTYISDETSNVTNIFLNKNFEVLINKGVKQEYVLHAIRREAILLKATNDYYELSMDCILKAKGKFGLYFNVEVPKLYKNDCNNLGYDAISLHNDSLKNLNVDFLERNPTFKSPYLYSTYNVLGVGGNGILLMIEVQ